jgi:hypothetical protein
MEKAARHLQTLKKKRRAASNKYRARWLVGRKRHQPYYRGAKMEHNLFLFTVSKGDRRWGGKAFWNPLPISADIHFCGASEPRYAVTTFY